MIETEVKLLRVQLQWEIFFMVKLTTLSVRHSSLVTLWKLKVKSSLSKLCSVLYVRINLGDGLKKITLKSPDAQVSTVCILELKPAPPIKQFCWFLSSQCRRIQARSDMYMRSRMSPSTPSHLQIAQGRSREAGEFFLP